MDLRKALKQAMQHEYGSGIVGGGIVGGAKRKSPKKKLKGDCEHCGHGCRDYDHDYEGLEEVIKTYLGNGIVGGARGRPVGSKNAKKRVGKNAHLLPYSTASKAIRGKKFKNAAARQLVVCHLADMYDHSEPPEANLAFMIQEVKSLKQSDPELFKRKKKMVME